jgi:hypothetical protein
MTGPEAPESPVVPSAETLRRARLFWLQSLQDLKEARRLLRAGAILHSGYASLQAALNALSAVCYLQGHVQLPQSSTMHMLSLCQGAHPRFESLAGACAALEEAAEQSPFAPQPEAVDGAAAGKARLEQSSEIIDTVRAYLKDNRKRFFAP